MGWVKNRKIIGIIIIVLTLGFLAFWELYGRVNFGYEKIVVLKESIEQGQIISKDLLEEKAVEHVQKGVITIEDYQKIIGMQAAQRIPKSEALYPFYFENPSFSANHGEDRLVLSIPREWLKTYPQTVRRGDTLLFFHGGNLVTEAMVCFAKDSNNQEILSSDVERIRPGGNVSLIEVIVTKEQAGILNKLSDEGAKFLVLYG